MRTQLSPRLVQELSLTPGQQALWMLQQLFPESGIYNTHYAWDVPDSIDIDIFKKTLAVVTERHPPLRTLYSIDRNGLPCQRIYDFLPPLFEEILIPDTETANLDEILDGHLHRVFHLDKEPPMRWILFRRTSAPNVMAFFHHHICVDLWSFMILMNEIECIYSEFSKGNQDSICLPQITSTFSDFVFEQNSFLKSEAGRIVSDFWRKELEDLPAFTDLPVSLARLPLRTCKKSLHHFNIDALLLNNFQNKFTSASITPFSLFEALFHILLFRYTKQNDIAIGLPTAGRDNNYQGVYGYFSNSIIIRAKLDENSSFQEFLATHNETIARCLDAKDFPFPLLADYVNDARDPSRAPLVQICLVWENINRFLNRDHHKVILGEENREIWQMGDLGEWKRHPRVQQTDDFDLTLKIHKYKNQYYFGIEYNRDLFTPESITNFSIHFQSLMDQVTRFPDLPLGQLQLLSSQEYQTTVIQWNATHETYEKNTLPTLAARYADEFPQKTAIEYENQAVTYAELDQRANQLAHYLVKRKVERESIVGVYLDRSPEVIICLLGIMKAGAAYLPLDPDYPLDRLRFILDDAKPALVISRRQLVQERSLSVPVVYWEECRFEAHQKDSPRVTLNPKDLAYIIYTSGSTGKPKGVLIEHGGTSHMLHAQKLMSATRDDRVLQQASINFDASIFEISIALGIGATLVIAKKTDVLGPALLTLLKNRKITWAIVPPALLAHLEPIELPQLKTLAVAGDACSATLAKKWSRGRRFFNAYGPTEVTIWATLAEVDGSCPPPIGKPIPNAQVYILDSQNIPQPPGLPGELHIGGDGLARGYLNRPELSAEKFIANPFSKLPGSRLYRTGDLARFLPDGNIEFLGRIDFQVKIRGYRIELGEIETVLRDSPAVNDALVIERTDLPNHLGEKTLVAYIVKSEKKSLSAIELRTYLKRHLPDYMIPAAFITLDAFPLTPNEKIDRGALPVPNLAFRDKVSDAHKGPRNEVEKQIATVWKEVLGVTEICITENFFDLGGHSLLLAQVHAKLPLFLQNKIKIVDLFRYPTIQALAHYLEKDTEEDNIFIQPDNHADRLRLRMRYMQHLGRSQIAIVGMAGRFPGAEDVETFWQNICDKKDCITFFSREELLAVGIPEELITDSNYVPAKGALNNISGFEAPFFNFTPREAQITDPQQRLFLECAWEVLEDAGCVPAKFNGRMGVYAGIGMNQYLMNNLSTRLDLLDAVGDYPVMIGNDKDFLSTRVSYKLNLNGPAMVLQTACSTSLVAIHTACQALINEECDAAIAGGVSFGRLGKTGYLYQEGMVMSKDGHCRAFDAEASGTVQGQGCGVVLLKRLKDAMDDRDHIYAIIKGSATNNDGSLKTGYTAPSIEGQAKAIRAAQAAANISAEQVSYIEAHGTGTPIGDPIEFEALTQAFIQSAADSKSSAKGSALPKQYCAMGSVKTNIGHLDAASGVAGLIKTAKAIERKCLPPSLHFRQPNPKIDFSNSPFYVNTETTEWKKEGRRYAGVSSFGIGGTNAHVILTDPPTQDPPGQVRPWQIVTLSARTSSALDAMTNRFSRHLETRKDQDFANICYTLHVGRTDFNHRRYLVCRNREEAIAQLSSPHSPHVITSKHKDYPRKVVFMFPGQGSQYQNMGRLLYKVEPTFRDCFDKCFDLLNEKFLFIFEHLDKDDFLSSDKMHLSYISPPVVFIFEYAMATMLMEWGIKPDVMVGHSFGEYVAACLAGVFTLDEALELVTIRGYLIHEQIREKGEMLSVNLPEHEARLLTHHDVCLAAINGERRCVLSGSSKAIRYLHQQLEERGIENRILHISHAAHSHMMEPILERFESYVARRNPRAPKIPFVSTKTGRLITDEEAMSPAYWSAHTRDTVRFHQAMESILTNRTSPDEAIIALEVGPGNTLTTFTKQHPGLAPQDVIKSTTRHPLAEISDCEHLLHVVAQLWEQGIKLDWEAFHKHGSRYRVPLPTYPFERKEHWIHANLVHTSASTTASELESDKLEDIYDVSEMSANVVMPTDIVEQQIWEHWVRALGRKDFGISHDFFDLGGDSLLAVNLMDRLQSLFNMPLPNHLLIQKPTIIELAQHIRNHSAQVSSMSNQNRPTTSTQYILQTNEQTLPAIIIPENSTLVMIQQGNSRSMPLIMIHPIGGEVFFYRDLARYLGRSQPVYAFQAASLSGKASPIASIPELAANYLGELAALGINPPYLLGGSSFGGLVAYEMAQQLDRDHQQVNLVVMIDTPCPTNMPRSLEDSAAILHYLLQDKIQLSLRELQGLDVKAQLNYVMEQARLQGKGMELPPHLGIPMFNTWLAHQKAVLNYNTQPYDGDVVFFQHTEPMNGSPTSTGVPWKALVAEGKLKIYPVPGNHITMNYAPHVKTLVEHLKPILEKAKCKPLAK